MVLSSYDLPLFLNLLLYSLVFFLFPSFMFPNSFVYAQQHQQQPLCHGDDLSALLQFKAGFFINSSASGKPSAYPKVSSWKTEGESRDCCLWDGVECDPDTGHVIGLNLNSSFLYGSINSSSSLFDLVHLQRLNLADNDFKLSHIPPSIGRLSRLTSLDLSYSNFFGQIPSEVLSLSKLTYLDLSVNGWYNIWGDSLSLLKLEKPSLEDLVQNLPNLKVLDLSVVNMSSSPVPRALSNMSSLTYLGLQFCGLYGEFPKKVFELTNLQYINLIYNTHLTGSLPEFNSSNSLQELRAAHTAFSGNLPDSIGNLKALRVMILADSNFKGQLPSSMANLSRLTVLSLSRNNFDVGIPPFPLGLLSQLVRLDLVDMKIQGQIPESLSNLTRLNRLLLSGNELVGQIPPSMGNHSQLSVLDLHANHLHATIPSSITQLRQLEYLDLSTNKLSGKVDLANILTMLPNLYLLQLSETNLTVLTKNSKNDTVAQLQILSLTSSNLRKFPEVLQSQNKLEILYLRDNKIEGDIPTWFWNRTWEDLRLLDLEHNFLTGFEKHLDVIPWPSLRYLYLSFNRFQGPVPIPPQTTTVYRVNGNFLSGEIPNSICYNSSLRILDLSDNNLSGRVPQCLLDSIESLAVLNVSGNNLSGSIPQIRGTRINLMMIDLGRNQLHGRLPKSLANCMMLKILVLGKNQIEDTFPSWLGKLSNLEVLVLQSNNFYGAMEDPHADTSSWFPKLRIIDLSHNFFNGSVCSNCIQRWSSMKMIKPTSSLYVQGDQVLNNAGASRQILADYTYEYSVTLVVKGTQRLYPKILNALVVIDLSNNNFQGVIPESVATLIGLQVLNISNNNLTGVIPSSLGNLTRMESLDVSQNNLFGEIPQQLNQLTYLAVINLSRNHLTGRIPRGKQFDTFDNSSYGGNPGLCGLPLSKLCEDSDANSPPSSSSFRDDDDELKFPSSVVDWIVVSMGYAGGIAVGLIVGQILTTRYHEWLVYKFGPGKKKTRRIQRRN